VCFQLNQLAFMPMVGMGNAVSILVGRHLGGDKPELAWRTSWVAAGMCLSYMTAIAIAFVTIPDVLMFPFSVGANPEQFSQLRGVAATLLWFVAFYSLFDTGNIIFSGTLKGAGDTRFVMVVTVCLSITMLVIPSILVVKLHWGLYTAWSFATAYVCALAVVFMMRVIAGKWKSMRVIERAPHPPAGAKLPTLTGEVEP